MNNQNEELMHYGVIGMKWGVRHDTARAYERAVNKANKLSSNVEKARKASVNASIKAKTGVAVKYQKLQTKADKAQYKADKKKYGIFSNSKKAKELQDKADKAQYKADKYKYRSEQRQAKASHAESKYLKTQLKAEKWAKAMNKEFSYKKLSQLQNKQVEKGTEYAMKKAKEIAKLNNIINPKETQKA